MVVRYIKNFNKYNTMMAYGSLANPYLYVDVKNKKNNISLGGSLGYRGAEIHLAHTEKNKQVKLKYNHTFNKSSIKVINPLGYLRKLF